MMRYLQNGGTEIIAGLQQNTLSFLLDVTGEQEADGAVGQLEDERTVILAGILPIATSLRRRPECRAGMEQLEVNTINDGRPVPCGHNILIDATLHRHIA
jgi:hypothetical protein